MDDGQEIFCHKLSTWDGAMSYGRKGEGMRWIVVRECCRKGEIRCNKREEEVTKTDFALEKLSVSSREGLIDSYVDFDSGSIVRLFNNTLSATEQFSATKLRDEWMVLSITCFLGPQGVFFLNCLLYKPLPAWDIYL